LSGRRLKAAVAKLMATAQKQSWALVALDCAVDTSTPAGEAMRTCSPPSGSSNDA